MIPFWDHGYSVFERFIAPTGHFRRAAGIHLVGFLAVLIPVSSDFERSGWRRAALPATLCDRTRLVKRYTWLIPHRKFGGRTCKYTAQRLNLCDTARKMRQDPRKIFGQRSKFDHRHPVGAPMRCTAGSSIKLICRSCQLRIPIPES